MFRKKGALVAARLMILRNASVKKLHRGRSLMCNSFRKISRVAKKYKKGSFLGELRIFGLLFDWVISRHWLSSELKLVLYRNISFGDDSDLLHAKDFQSFHYFVILGEFSLPVF